MRNANPKSFALVGAAFIGLGVTTIIHPVSILLGAMFLIVAAIWAARRATN